MLSPVLDPECRQGTGRHRIQAQMMRGSPRKQAQTPAPGLSPGLASLLTVLEMACLLRSWLCLCQLRGLDGGLPHPGERGPLSTGRREGGSRQPSEEGAGSQGCPRWWPSLKWWLEGDGGAFLVPDWCHLSPWHLNLCLHPASQLLIW